MVIGDHHVDAGLAGGLDGFDGGDAAVTGDHERGARPLGRLQSGGTEVVPVTKPVRHKGEHIGPGDSQGPSEQGGRTLSVHVVIPMHQNPAATSHRSNDG